MILRGSVWARVLLSPFVATLATAGGAQANDSILSRHFKEADNLGQDVNSGSGIKTGHLANGAVTAPKLGAGAVGTAAFAAASHDHSNARKKNSRGLVVAHDGSGQDLTVTWSECPALSIGPPMVMAWALEGAEFRDLTLQMRTGGPGSVYSGVIIDSGSLRLSRVRVLCQSTGGGECAQAFEVRFGGQLVIEDSVVQTDGAGFRLFSSRPCIDTPVVVWVRGGEVDAPTGAVAVNAETGDLTRLYAAGAQFYGPLLYPGSVSPDVPPDRPTTPDSAGLPL